MIQAVTEVFLPIFQNWENRRIEMNILIEFGGIKISSLK